MKRVNRTRLTYRRGVRRSGRVNGFLLWLICMDVDYISAESQWGWWGWIGTGWINFRRVLAHVLDKTQANTLAYRTSIKLYGTSFLPPALNFTPSCRNTIRSLKPFGRRRTLGKTAVFFFIALERFIHHTIIDVWRSDNVTNNFCLLILHFKIIVFFLGHIIY